MEESLDVLQLVADQGTLDRVDRSSEVSADLVAELIESGLLKGTWVPQFGEPSLFLDVRITTAGREYLETARHKNLESTLRVRVLRFAATTTGKIVVGVIIALMVALIAG